MSTKKFELGRIVCTRGIASRIDSSVLSWNEINDILSRYHNCDWGDTCKEDSVINNVSINNNDRIVALYRLSDNTEIFIITEADRNYTTIMLTEEY